MRKFRVVLTLALSFLLVFGLFAGCNGGGEDEKKALTSITVSGDYATVYTEGDTFEAEELTVTAHYDDESSKNVTNYTLTPSATTALAVSDIKVTVSYTEGGVTKTKDITITVNPLRVLDDIVVATPPNKTVYIEGELFDPAGLTLTAVYDNGDEEPVTSGFTYAPDGPLTPEDTEIGISWGGEYVTTPITVNERVEVDPTKTVTEITVTTPPAKLAYLAGEKFDPSGIILKAAYDDGTFLEGINSGFDWDNKDELEVEDTVIKITLNALDDPTMYAEVTISVKEMDAVIITDKSTVKTEYNAGELFDPTGLVLQVWYTDNSHDDNITTGYEWSPSGPLTDADTEVTFTYNGIDVDGTVEITVTDSTKVTGVTLDKPYVSIVEGDTETVTLTPTVLPESAVDKSVTWSVEPAGVATVSQTGVVTAVAEGNTVVTATTTDGEFEASCEVYVTYRPTGTAIRTAADFLNISNNLSGTYYLMNDIDFGGAEIDPIGAYSDAGAFKGVFDGRGYALKNFTLKNPGQRNGVFQRIGLNPAVGNPADGLNGWVKNVSILNATINGPGVSGAITGDNRGLIENVYVEANLVFNGGNCGVIAGANENELGIVNNVVSKALNAPAGTAGVTGWNGPVTNAFVVTDGLNGDGKARFIESAGGNAAAPQVPGTTAGVTGGALFTLAEVAAQDFSALEDKYWFKEEGKLPVLRNLGAVFATPVTGVTLDEETKLGFTIEGGEFTLNVPMVDQLFVNITPLDAYQGVEWSKEILSGTGDVIYLDPTNGTVTAVSVGTVRVTATTVDGGFTASCEITITNEDLSLTGLTLANSEKVLYLDGNNLLDAGAEAMFKTTTLKVTTEPDFPTNGMVWSVLDANGETAHDGSIATVDQNGVVTAVSVGEVIVRVESEDDATVFDECVITVEDYAAEIGIALYGVEDLDFIRKNRTLNFYLAGDIDVGGAAIVPLSTWDADPANFPASAVGGEETRRFTGVLDGKGYAIRNFKISGGYGTALFPRMENATVKNIALIGFEFNTGNGGQGGVIVGAMTGTSRVENIYLEGAFNGGGQGDWNTNGILSGLTRPTASGQDNGFHNIVVNVSTDTASTAVIAAESDGAGKGVFTNIFVVADGIAKPEPNLQASWANQNPQNFVFTNVNVFDLSDAGAVDYKGLPNAWWDKTGDLPVLKNYNFVPATGIEIDQESFSVNENSKGTLTATVLPLDGKGNSAAGDISYTWSITDLDGFEGEVVEANDVATIDPVTGEVTGLTAGFARVTVTATDDTNGTLTDTLDIEVTVNSDPVESVTLNKTAALLTMGLDGTATVQLSYTFTPDFPAISTFTYSVTDWDAGGGVAIGASTVASVTSGGLVTALAEGTAKVTLTADDESGVKAECMITVRDYTEYVATSVPISSKEDFEMIRTNLDKNFHLTQNIDFDGADFLAIGTDQNSDAQAFTGVLDGKGYAIQNIVIRSSGANRVGLFTRLGSNANTDVQTEAGENGLVKNLAITGAQVFGVEVTGAIAGNNFGLIQDCYVEAAVSITSGNYSNSGIIAGANEANKGMIKNCVANGSAVGDNVGNIGAILGWNNRIVNCFAVIDDIPGGKLSVAADNNDVDAIIIIRAQIGDVDFSSLDDDGADGLRGIWNISTPGALPTLIVQP